MSGRGGRTRAVLAQNLFRSSGVAERLVRIAGVEAGARVYDLGAGTGHVTSALLAAGASVIAVERDPTLAARLAQRFAGSDVRVLNDDLTRASFAPPYHVVANLPFNATAAALRRLMFEGPPPQTATLVLQREAARKWAGLGAGSAVSLALQPWFAFEVSTPFQRRDFVPAPACEVAVLRISTRHPPLLEPGRRESWERFVRHGFAHRHADARRMFKALLSNLQWRRLSSDLDIPGGALRAQLTLEQWLGVFRFALASAAPAKRARVVGGVIPSHQRGGENATRRRSSGSGTLRCRG